MVTKVHFLIVSFKKNGSLLTPSSASPLPRLTCGCISIYYCFCKQKCHAFRLFHSPRRLLNVISAKVCHMSVMYCHLPLLTAQWFSGGDDGLVPAGSSWAGQVQTGLSCGDCSMAVCRINTICTAVDSETLLSHTTLWMYQKHLWNTFQRIIFFGIAWRLKYHMISPVVIMDTFYNFGWVVGGAGGGYNCFCYLVE